MKSLWLSSMVLFLALPANAQKESKIPIEDQCTISGIVVAIADSAPLKKAHLVLQSADDPQRNISTMTNTDGRFALKKIAPGSYRLTVSRPGFANQTYGQRKPDAPGATLTLQPRQEIKDLLFRMIPAGIISGKVFDEDGEPISGVYVTALKQTYSEGKRGLSATTRAETNDLGEYRLYGLSAGRYFVSALYPRWSRYGDQEDAPTADSHDQGYAKLYYPGTADSSKAGSITVKSGEEVPSIEILMRPVSVHQIRGHVYNQITQKTEQETQLMLMPKARRGEWDFSNQAILKPDGSFEIPDALSGSYILLAYWFDADRTYMSRQTIEVGNTDVEGVAVTIGAGMTISGRIVWEGKPSLERDGLTVGPESSDVVFYVVGTRVGSDNTFTLKNLSEGTYRAVVSGQSKDCYVKNVRYGESNNAKNEFTVMRGEAQNLEITINSHGARVQGTVTDADGLPSSGVSVVLIPEPSRREQYELYKTANTDQYGHFDFRGIPPGDYKIFSWEEVEADSWQDPEFLRPFEGKSETISLFDDDHKKVKIAAIRVRNTENAPPE